MRVDQATSITTRLRYQPHVWHTVCGVFALPQRGHVLRAGAASFQLPARRLRVLDFDFFFFGTATGALRHFMKWHGTHRTTRAKEGYRLTRPLAHRPNQSSRRSWSSAAQRSSRTSVEHAHGAMLRSAPHNGQIPAHSGEHNGATGNSIMIVSRITGTRSI